MSVSEICESPAATGLDAEKTQRALVVVAEDHERKRYETARAIAAIAGITLHHLEGKDGAPLYIATKWNLTRELRSLDEVTSWLNTVIGCARRETIDEANRQQDALDEAADFLRGHGGVEATEGFA